LFLALGALAQADEPAGGDAASAVSVTAQKPAIGAVEAISGDSPRPNLAKPKAGKLVICGGGILPDELGRRFIELAGGQAARLVIITTASVLADTDRVEAKLAFWRRQQVADLKIMHTRSRETANQPEFAKPLKEASGVWFIGGNQNWLTETYLGTVTEKEIRGVLERDGVVGGTSAGAAIMSPIMIRRDKPDLEEGPGFGFLPGTVVDQHFIKRNRQSRLLRVLDSHPDLVGLGIDEGTALVIDGPKLSVMGESQVMVCSPNVPDQPPQVRPLKAGAEIDFASLRSEALTRRLGTEAIAARSRSKEDEGSSSEDDASSSEDDASSPVISSATVSVGADDRPAPSGGEASDEAKVGQ
jgi:cyanophycinase